MKNKEEMNINDFKEEISLLVGLLADQKYDSILSGQLNGFSLQDMHNRIQEYGCKIISLPDEAFDLAEAYFIESDKRLDVYLPLWTKEEGKSDLTLYVSCRIIDGKKETKINDVEVL